MSDRSYYEALEEQSHSFNEDKQFDREYPLSFPTSFWVSFYLKTLKKKREVKSIES